MKAIERIFEALLWNSRLVVIVAVIASLLTAFAVFYVATVDAVHLLGNVIHYSADSHAAELEHGEARNILIAGVVEIIDGYLLATVLLIFSLGLYELFISKIDAAYKDESASSVLIVNSLDDLKSRLAKVILMILIVKFFEHAIGMEFHTPMDLLIFSAGIALIGLGLYLSHAADPSDHSKGH